MKILIIAPQPFFSIRGTPLAVRELAGVLLKAGNSVDILTFHLGEDIPGVKIYRNKIFFKYIKTIPPGFSLGKLLLDIALLPKALWLIIKNKYDVVHCVEESAYFISLFRRLGRFVFTYDMDSDIPSQLEESGRIKSRIVLIFVKWLERFAVKRADAVITICPVFTKKILNISPDKQVFQIEDISVSDKITRTESSDKTTILYTGNLEKYQGVELLLEGFLRIAKRYGNARLVLAGGEEKEIIELKKRYSSSQIEFAGRKPLSEIPHFLQDADILVSPRTKGENTPYKIYSYLACGKPILATDIVSHSQILTNGEDTLLVKPAADDIADGLEKLLEDKAFADKIAKGARRLFEEKYTRACYEKKVGKYIKFLEDKLCKKKNKGQ